MDQPFHLNYQVCVGWDRETGKPTVSATDVSPGEESSVTDLARLLLGVVGEAAVPAAPVPKGNTPPWTRRSPRSSLHPG